MINSQIVSKQIIKNMKQEKSKMLKYFQVFKVEYFNLFKKKNVDLVLDAKI